MLSARKGHSGGEGAGGGPCARRVGSLYPRSRAVTVTGHRQLGHQKEAVFAAERARAWREVPACRQLCLSYLRAETASVSVDGCLMLSDIVRGSSSAPGRLEEISAVRHGPGTQQRAA